MWDEKELDRRESWLRRQRSKGRADLSLTDCPERGTVCTRMPTDYIEPCPVCGKFQWDLGEDDAERFCAPCAGRVLIAWDEEREQWVKSERELQICQHLRRKWRRRTA